MRGLFLLRYSTRRKDFLAAHRIMGWRMAPLGNIGAAAGRPLFDASKLFRPNDRLLRVRQPI